MLMFQPKKGDVVWCNFSGFVIPEMVKRRPVIIIKKHKHNSRLVYVLPISNLSPENIKDHHYKLDNEFCIKFFNDKDHWVKIDMIYTVSVERLDRVKTLDGERTIPSIDINTLEEIVNKFKKYYSM